MVGIRTAPFTEHFGSTPSQVSAEHQVSLLSFISQWSPTLTDAQQKPGKASCSGGFRQEAGPELESRLLGARGSEAD